MEKAQNTTSSSSQSQQTPGFGAILAAKRQELGISTGDMVVASRLSVAQIEALEAEDVSKLPEPVYVRAFIRSVAHVLHLDPAPLIEDYVKRYGTGQQNVGILPESDFTAEPIISHHVGHRVWRLVGVVVLLACLIAGAWYAFTDEGGLRSSLIDKVTGETSAPAATKTEAAAVQEAQHPEQVTSANTQSAVVSAVGAQAPVVPLPKEPTENPTPASAEAADPVAEIVAADAKKVSATEVNQSKEKATEPIPVANKNANSYQVNFNAKGDCWVEVIGPKGEKVFSRVVSAGTQASFNVPMGSRFTLGNAPAVSMTVDGKDYGLSRYAKNGVARFTLK